ncbi:MAG: Chromate transporter [Ilumatobacteraceae bacterium]|nr:Chromate transporter [Ilumatobacteraceae bacterium]
MASAHPSADRPRVGLGEVLIQWGRIGCIGFGGPPTHIALLRDLCVDRNQWLDPAEFEDAIAACNLLPGPASTQLAILSAWTVAGPIGAVAGGLAFILPGLIMILGLAAVFLVASPPTWILAAGAGAGAAVAAVAVHAGAGLAPASWRRAHARRRWLVYAALGAVAAATIGPLLAIVLIGCGAIELGFRRLARSDRVGAHANAFLLGAAAVTSGGLLGIGWVALKVGALSYGGGFVIIPLMQHDAVQHYHWMTNSQFLDAVALGQITPGPVVQTVAVVGYAAAGVGGGLLAAAVAFAPSFAFVLVGAPRFQALRRNAAARAFLDGAGPAAIGAIIGVAIPLALALGQRWQLALLCGASLSLFVLRRTVVVTLLLAAAIGIVVVQLGAPLP